VSLSLNETHKLVRDGARGSGLFPGESDELARAAVWLEVAGLPGLINANRAIDEHLNGLAGDVELTQRDGWQLSPRYAMGDGRIGALAAGICARDLVAAAIAAGDGGLHVRIDSVFLPLIAAGLIAPLDPGPAKRLVIETRNANSQATAMIVNTGDEIRMEESYIDAKPSHPLVDLSITIESGYSSAPLADGCCIWSPDVYRRALEQGLSPDRPARETMASLAKNCLVPATEDSRLKGAGAGTVDRD